MKEKIEYIECPRCRGYGEIMIREKLIDSDGSEDIGATPEVSGCPRCNGEGRIKAIMRYKKISKNKHNDKIKIDCPHCRNKQGLYRRTNRVQWKKCCKCGKIFDFDSLYKIKK